MHNLEIRRIKPLAGTNIPHGLLVADEHQLDFGVHLGKRRNSPEYSDFRGEIATHDI
jgi:hypothetical protein